MNTTSHKGHNIIFNENQNLFICTIEDSLFCHPHLYEVINYIDTYKRFNLKPCPFCGYSYINGPNYKQYVWSLECDMCAAKIAQRVDTPEEIVKAWNRRERTYSEEDYEEST
jgi:Lar family restriction alleviation protein